MWTIHQRIVITVFFRQNMSQHWDLNDYCFLNKKSTSRIIMDKDCPLEELEEKDT